MTSPDTTYTAGRAPAFPEFVALMAAMMALTALSIDVMLPALPLIQEAYALSDPNQQQLVVTLYVLGFGIGQFFFGPLSDWLGRKAILGFGLLFYAAASFLCLSAGTFEMLLGARFLQGVANAAPRVIAIAVIRDVYGGRRMAEVMSFVMMVFIMVPAIAPSIGSLILLGGDWHLIFAMLCVVSLAIMLWTMARLPETRPAELREPLSVAWLLQAFGETLRTRQTLGYTIATGAVFGGMMSYINSAHQIFVGIYNVGDLFPIVFGAVAVALAAAAVVNSRLVGQLGMRKIGHTAVCAYAAVALVHLIVELLPGQAPLPIFLILMACQLFTFGFIMPNFNSLAMEPMGRIAGTASSFFGAVTTALAAILGWVVGQAFNGTALPIAIGFLVFGLVALAITLVVERGRLFQPSPQI